MEVDKKRRYTGLHEDYRITDESDGRSVERVCLMPSYLLHESLYSLTNCSRYCNLVNTDHITLRKALAGRVNNFSHWICNE